MFENENGKEQFLLKLCELFHDREDLISTGELKVCFTATVISFINNCFSNVQYYSEYHKSRIKVLKQCIPTIHTLKVVSGPTFKFSLLVDISHFQGLQVLEISKLAIEYISGLQSLRPTIKYLAVNRSISKIKDVLVLCGSDQSTEFAWPHLNHVDFSFNNIIYLDSSLRLLTLLKSLNLSHNNLAAAEKENWVYLPEVTWLHLGHNQLTKIPCFSEQCCSKITTLLLTNNDLDRLEGLEVLSNLEVLDISMNCISEYSSCFPLACLQKLVSLKCFDNPIAYLNDYRPTLISCLSPSPRNYPIVLDGNPLNIHEMCILGNSVEVDFSNFIPSRPYGSPINMSGSLDPEVAFQQSIEAIGARPREKRKGRKPVIQQPLILNIGEEYDKETDLSSGNDIMKRSEKLEHIQRDNRSASKEASILSPRHEKNGKKTSVPERPLPNKVEIDEVKDEASWSFLQQGNSREKNPFLEYSPPTKIEIDKIQDGCFLFSVREPPLRGQEPRLEHVFVSVKEDDIVEYDISLKVKRTLDLHSLLEVKVFTAEKNITIQLIFDYVNERKRIREYIVDDEEEQRFEEFVSFIKTFIRKPTENDVTTQRYKIKCLNCSHEVFTEDDIAECGRCKSPMLFDVSKPAVPASNATQPNKHVPARMPTQQDPDIIPKAVNPSEVPPDVCSASLEQDQNNLDTEYGTLVSSIRLKSKDFESSYSDSKDTEINEMFVSLTKNESDAVDITNNRLSPRATKTLLHKLRESSSSPLQSFASSLSDTESRRSSPSRTPTPVGGQRQTEIRFSMDSCTDCDHRLKLYFETRMFKGGEEEEFCCMIKCPAVSYGYSQGVPSLLVISNIMVYIFKVTGLVSAQPNEWLALKVSYLLTELRHLEYGLQNQSFRLEFAKESGCHTFLVGDSERCDNFLLTLRGIVKKSARQNIGQSVTVSKANPQTLTNIKVQIFGVKDESLIAKSQRLYEQAVNFTHPPLVKDRKVWFRSLPQSMLGEEFIDWLIRHKEATNYREAVHVGQVLLDAGVIQCFDKDISLLDKDRYYFFNLFETTDKANLNKDPKSDEHDSTEINTTIRQYFLGKWDTASNRKDADNRLVPVSIIVSKSHIALAEENHQWPLPRFHEPPVSIAGPQFVFIAKQKITNITEVNIFAERVCEIEIEFHDEDMPDNDRDGHWLLGFETEDAIETFLEGIKEIWEEQFGVELPLNLFEITES